jgi:hypothetical protein
MEVSMATTYSANYIENEAEVRAELHKIAEYLDSMYEVPYFGWKIGWDGILGIIPGAGDLLTNIFSFYIVYKAAMLGCSPTVILRMGINILIDNFLDAIPIVGNIFDFMWKSNIKNVDLLDRYLERPRVTTRHSRIVVALTLLFVAAVFIGCIVLTFYLATWIIGFFKAW